MEALERRGLRVWVDTIRNDTFEGITESVTSGLAQSKALLAYYSATYPTRPACQWELTSAFVAAQRAGDPRRRILAVNPERGTGHIEVLALRDTLVPHVPERGTPALTDLAEQIEARIADLDGALGDLQSLPAPQWTPVQHTGSTRFVGRWRELWRVHSGLSASGLGLISGSAGAECVLVTGLGGVGKSLLAEEYARRFGMAWPGRVFWFGPVGNERDRERGASRARAVFDRQMQEAAETLGLPGTEDPVSARAALAGWISGQEQRCLWVVDDVPAGLRAEELRWFLAPDPLAASLLTSRSRAYAQLAQTVDLDVLPAEDAYALLTRHHRPADPEQERELRALVDALGGHPLAVEVAGGILAHGVLQAGELRRWLADGIATVDMLAGTLREELPTGHGRSIVNTLARSILQLGPEGLDVLRLAALLASAPLSRRFVVDIFAELDDLDDVWAVLRAHHGLAQAQERSLARRRSADPEHGGWQVHPLVSRVLLEVDPDADRRTRLLKAAESARADQTRDLYEGLAEHPHKPYPFWFGRTLAERFGYPAELLDRVPEEAFGTFAGVGYVLDAAELTEGERILDLGCGSGTDVFAAALLVGADGRAVGVDMAYGQVAAAGRFNGKANVAFVHGRAERLPFRNGAFDVIISNGSINLCPDKPRVFREAARVLAPAGRLAVADLVSSRPLPESVRLNADLWACCIGGVIPEADYRAVAEAAGLRVREVRRDTYAFADRQAQEAAEKWGIYSVRLVGDAA